ncbi:hypothetical protein TrVE_jg4743 [Triparma verrucosa]|uniref:Amine oxidase domain-containing protein n=2 Tax=Triparma TaxID=722752 RepID=A0A9W7E6R3_9STRA|nr:hypothetical protein TrST_g12355 [Triparma strigata]GMI07124.1 hypothetical protein TrVE_jg4743 [Triparma verrucosa]
MKEERKRVAIIGSGIAGLASCHILGEKYDVTIFEREATLGMDSQSISIPPCTSRVDVPLRIFNPRFYPLLTKLYTSTAVSFAPCSSEFSSSWITKEKGVAGYFKYSNLSIGKLGIPYFSLNLSPMNWLTSKHKYRPSYLKTLYSTVLHSVSLFRFFLFSPFYIGARSALGMKPTTLGQYLKGGLVPYPKAFIYDLLYPMLSVVCTCSYSSLDAYPAKTIIEYYNTYGILTWFPNPLRTRLQYGGAHCRVTEGINSVCEKLSKRATTCVFNSNVTEVVPGEKPLVVSGDGSSREFDYVVVATQPHHASALLPQAKPELLDALKQWKYEHSSVYVHRCDSLMPSRECDWSNVNIMVGPRTTGLDGSQCSIWLNRLDDSIPKDVYQTWNPAFKLEDEKILKYAEFTRPVVTMDTEKHCKVVKENQGSGGVFLVGSYSRFDMPLLENAVKSGKEVGEILDVKF